MATTGDNTTAPKMCTYAEAMQVAVHAGAEIVAGELRAVNAVAARLAIRWAVKNPSRATDPRYVEKAARICLWVAVALRANRPACDECGAGVGQSCEPYCYGSLGIDD